MYKYANPDCPICHGQPRLAVRGKSGWDTFHCPRCRDEFFEKPIKKEYRNPFTQEIL